MIRVKELQTTALPKQFLDTLPQCCPFCDSNWDTEISEGLTFLQCTNPCCKSKLARRMTGLLSDLGIKNLGSSKCSAFITYHNADSAYSLFEWAHRDGTFDDVLYSGCSKEFSSTIAAQINNSRGLLLWEYVRNGNFPGVRDSAKALFSKYNTIDDFYDDLEAAEDPLEHISNLLSIAYTPGSESVRATATYNVIVSAKDELVYYQQFFDFIHTEKTLNICMSTAVGAPYKSKADFIAQINKEYADCIHINNLSAVTKDCDYLIWSKAGALTSKAEKAYAKNIPVLTGRAFNILLSLGRQGKDMAKIGVKLAALEDINPKFSVADAESLL